MADITLTIQETSSLLTKIITFIEDNRSTLELKGTYNEIEFWTSGNKVTFSYTGILTIESTHRVRMFLGYLPEEVATLGYSIFTLLREILDERAAQMKKQFLEGFGL